MKTIWGPRLTSWLRYGIRAPPCFRTSLLSYHPFWKLLSPHVTINEKNADTNNPSVQELKQEDPKFEVSLSNSSRSYLKTNIKKASEVTLPCFGWFVYIAFVFETGSCYLTQTGPLSLASASSTLGTQLCAPTIQFAFCVFITSFKILPLHTFLPFHSSQITKKRKQQTNKQMKQPLSSYPPSKNEI